jgi:hypothetical protein
VPNSIDEEGMLNHGGDKERSKNVDNAFFLVTSSGCMGIGSETAPKIAD